MNQKGQLWVLSGINFGWFLVPGDALGTSWGCLEACSWKRGRGPEFLGCPPGRLWELLAAIGSPLGSFWVPLGDLLAPFGTKNQWKIDAKIDAEKVMNNHQKSMQKWMQNWRPNPLKVWNCRRKTSFSCFWIGVEKLTKKGWESDKKMNQKWSQMNEKV